MKKGSFGKTLSDLLPGPEEDPRSIPAMDRAMPVRANGGEAQGRGKTSVIERELGIVPFTFHISPSDKRRLKILAIERGLSAHALAHEVWSTYLINAGLDPLTPVKASIPDGRRKR